MIAAIPNPIVETILAFATIIVEKRGPAFWVHLNRPEALNSLTLDLADELQAAIAAAEADPHIRA